MFLERRKKIRDIIEAKLSFYHEYILITVGRRSSPPLLLDFCFDFLASASSNRSSVSTITVETSIVAAMIANAITKVELRCLFTIMIIKFEVSYLIM